MVKTFINEGFASPKQLGGTKRQTSYRSLPADMTLPHLSKLINELHVFESYLHCCFSKGIKTFLFSIIHAESIVSKKHVNGLLVIRKGCYINSINCSWQPLFPHTQISTLCWWWSIRSLPLRHICSQIDKKVLATPLCLHKYGWHGNKYGRGKSITRGQERKCLTQSIFPLSALQYF